MQFLAIPLIPQVNFWQALNIFHFFRFLEHSNNTVQRQHCSQENRLLELLRLNVTKNNLCRSNFFINVYLPTSLPVVFNYIQLHLLLKKLELWSRQQSSDFIVMKYRE